MRSVLPEYVVNCLLASGYDVAEVFAVDHDNPGNSIETIGIMRFDELLYQKEDRTPAMYQAHLLSHLFFLLHGHRIRIMNFVIDVRKRIKVACGVVRKPEDNVKNSN